MRPAAVAIALVLAVLAAPRIADAQSTAKVPRLGMILEQANAPFLAAFRQGLRDLGYTEGSTIVIEYRRVGALEQVPDATAELVRTGVDLLVVPGTAAARLARNATATVPIVFVTAGDPVGSGLVASLSHPGGNATGLFVVVPDLTAKQMDLLKTAVPRLARVTVLYNPDNTDVAKAALASAREAGRALGMEVDGVEARHRSDLTRALSSLTPRRAGALLTVSDPVFGAEMGEIARLVAANRLPAIFHRREFAEGGGLLSYGPSFADNYRRAATYVDKILKGAKPAALPVEQPDKFELVINLKTAKTLGLDLPPALVNRADTVIR